MKTQFTVTGPGQDVTKPSAEIGMSAATTFANRAAIRREAATYYVRDAAGEIVGHAESHENRSITIQVRG